MAARERRRSSGLMIALEERGAPGGRDGAFAIFRFRRGAGAGEHSG